MTKSLEKNQRILLFYCFQTLLNSESVYKHEKRPDPLNTKVSRNMEKTKFFSTECVWKHEERPNYLSKECSYKRVKRTNPLNTK